MSISDRILLTASYRLTRRQEMAAIEGEFLPRDEEHLPAAIPHWISSMSEERRQEYFDEHPNSIYNPNRPASQEARDRVANIIPDSFHDTLNERTGGRWASAENKLNILANALTMYESKFHQLSESHMGEFLKFAAVFAVNLI